jgi:2-hydroxyacyl-CoA lyase 1
VIEAFGGRGYFVTQPDELKPALEAANNGDGPAIVHILINPRAQRKPQKFDWHTGRT